MGCSGSVVRTIARAFLFAALAAGIGCGGGGGGNDDAPIDTVPPVRIEALVTGRDFPVGAAVAPDGRIFFTELRTGQIRIFGSGQLFERPFATLEVPSSGADGALGIALDSSFIDNRYVYVFHIAPNPSRGRVVRFTDQAGFGTDPKILLDNLPVGGHNGGKIVSLRDGTLFVSQGDTGNPALSQDLSTTAGKILHITREGAPAAGAPYPNAIYALGFRNVFGLAYDEDHDRLYASENGPDCDDEVDVVRRGENYGWRPGQPCGDTDPSYAAPLVRITPSLGVTGAAIYSGGELPELMGDLLLADYNTGSVRRYRIEDGSRVTREDVVFAGGLGGITDIAIDPNGGIILVAGNGVYRLVRATE